MQFVGDQHPAVAQGALCRAGRIGLDLRGRRLHRTRQVEGESGAGAWAALHRDFAARLLGEAIDLGEAESGPLADAFRGEEGLEHVVQVLRRDA